MMITDAELQELVSASRELCSHLEDVLDHHPSIIKRIKPAPTVKRVLEAIAAIEGSRE